MRLAVQWICVNARLWAIIIGFSIVAVPAHGEDSVSSMLLSRRQLKERIAQEENGPKKGALIALLLNGAPVATINELCCDDNSALAIAAAWQRVATQVSARLEGDDRGASLLPVPREFTKEFVGFVEGRLKVPLPGSWLKCICGIRFSRNGDTLLPVQLYAPDRINTKGFARIFSGRRALPSVHLNRKETPINIVINGGGRFEGSDGLLIIPEMPEELAQLVSQCDPESISGICGDDRGVIVVQYPNSPGGDLFCLSKRRPLGGDPRVLWSGTLDARWADSTKGLTHWFTEVRIRDDCVYLFHCSDDSFGIEAIALADGKRLFSFNSRPAGVKNE